MVELTHKQQQELVQAAINARKNAYAPYSKFSVGAAALGADGKIYTGCNIENASYGMTMCAERTAIFKMVSEGCTAFAALAVVAGDNAADGAPCGACRQVMLEFAADINTSQVLLANLKGEFIVETVGGICPYPFVKFTPQE